MNHTQHRDEHATKEELLREVKKLRQQLEEQEQEVLQAQQTADAASQVEQKLLANISHDIRTPMNAIMGMAELLMDTPLTPEQQEFVRIFHTNSDMLLQMLNNLVGFSEASTNEITLRTEDFDLLTLVETTCEFLAPRAHRKSLELNYEIDPSFPTFLRGDPTRLRQIFINLIGNGIKFTEKGEVMIHCKCLSESPERVKWLFSISDTGIGMPKSRLTRILESLSHTERSLFELGAEIELGLAISKHLIELMGGRIWIESEEHHGTTCHFTAAFIPQEKPQKPLRIYPERLQGLNVLVVDDNAANRSILKKMLRRWGVQVAEVNNGQQGVLELQRAHRAQKPYDLILLDSAMPNVDGFQMAKHIHDEPAITSVPIMMLTENDRQELQEKAEDIEVSAYMLKPIKRFELLHAIGAALQPSSQPASQTNRIPDISRGLHILLVEDYIHNQVIVQQYLKNTSYHLDFAENGAIAVEKFTQSHYDLILMDIQMPVMNGYEATRRIREIEVRQAGKTEVQTSEGQPATRVPIIALTAYALKDAPGKSHSAGCDAHLNKPLKKSQLLEMLSIYQQERDHNGAPEKSGQESTPNRKNVVFAPDAPKQDDNEKHDTPQTTYVPQEFAEYIPEFIQDVRQDLETMTQAFTQRDYATIQSISHQIKGAGGGYGLETISDITRELEMAARQKEQTHVRQRLHKLKEFLNQLQIAYRTHSGQMKTII